MTDRYLPVLELIYCKKESIQFNSIPYLFSINQNNYIFIANQNNWEPITEYKLNYDNNEKGFANKSELITIKLRQILVLKKVNLNFLLRANFALSEWFDQIFIFFAFSFINTSSLKKVSHKSASNLIKILVAIQMAIKSYQEIPFVDTRNNFNEFHLKLLLENQ